MTLSTVTVDVMLCNPEFDETTFNGSGKFKRQSDPNIANLRNDVVDKVFVCHGFGQG